MSHTGITTFGHTWSESTTDISTVVDITSEPVIILDEHLRVCAANEPFYQLFDMHPTQTEGKLLATLGEGQWNMPSLHILLESVALHKTFFKGFEMQYRSPMSGRKVLLLSAREIYSRNLTRAIMLALEDITSMIKMAEKIVRQQTA